VGIAVTDSGYTPHRLIEDDRIRIRESFVPEDSGPEDPIGHGTAILSQIFGREDTPIPGLATEAEGMALRIFDAGGMTSLSAILLANEAALSNGARILNISYGGSESNPLLAMSFRRLYEQGMTLIAAAGNEGPAPGTMGYPARYPEVIAIGATDQEGRLCEFSSRGRPHEYGPDLCTFGSHMILARAAGTAMGTPLDDDLCMADGTSFACPLVVGIAALLIEEAPQRGPEDIRAILRRSCVPLE
jgi:subtilisin family serine protease